MKPEYTLDQQEFHSLVIEVSCHGARITDIRKGSGDNDTNKVGKMLVLIFVIAFFTISNNSYSQEVDQSQPQALICSLIGGSFDSAGNDSFTPLSHKRLDLALNALGAQVGVSVHSVAIPGSTTQDIILQTDRVIEMYANTPPEHQMNCLIIGISISIFDNSDGLSDAVERAVQAARKAGIPVVAIGYPSARDVTAEWIDQLSSGTLTTDLYDARARSYQQRISALGVPFVDAWRGYKQLHDDFHPTWQSSLRAAVRILSELL
jgi:hypothetical protein